jgi:hypothetical protein
LNENNERKIGAKVVAKVASNLIGAPVKRYLGANVLFFSHFD